MAEPKNPNPEFDPEDLESDEEAALRAAAMKRRAQLGSAGKMVDPKTAARGSGRKTVYGPEFTGDNPSSHVYSGEIAPALAGERSKAAAVVNGVKQFVEKYSKMAVDTFRGSEEPTLHTTTGEREKRTGSLSQMMDKDKALKLIDDLPMMPQDQMFAASRALGTYIWKIHGNARKNLRDQVKEKLGPHVSTDDPQFQDALRVASREFDTDSVQVKADLNLLAAAAGALKRSGGKLGAADATFLAKQPRFGQPPKVVAKDPTARLTPQLATLANEPAPTMAARPRPVPGTNVQKKGDVRPVMPIVRKKHEAFDRWLDEMVGYASADLSPQWWDDI